MATTSLDPDGRIAIRTKVGSSAMTVLLEITAAESPTYIGGLACNAGDRVADGVGRRDRRSDHREQPPPWPARPQSRPIGPIGGSPVILIQSPACSYLTVTGWADTVAATTSTQFSARQRVTGAPAVASATSRSYCSGAVVQAPSGVGLLVP